MVSKVMVLRRNVSQQASPACQAAQPSQLSQSASQPALSHKQADDPITSEADTSVMVQARERQVAAQT